MTDTSTEPTPLQTVLIGASWWGERLAAAIDTSEYATLDAVVDLRESRATSLATEHGATGWTDLAEALDTDRFDVAVIAVPPTQHASVAAQCLDAGLHVYLEKPAGRSDDPEEILRLGDRAAENNVVLMPGYSQRYHPFARETIDAVEAGTIGEVYSIDILRQTDWKPDPADGPGWGIHDYDLCCYLADAAPAEIHPFSPETDGTPDPATVEVLVMHDNGVLSRCRTHTRAESLEVILRVHGDAGEIVGYRVGQRVTIRTPEETVELEYETSPPFEQHAIRAFFAALVAGESPPITPEEVVRGRQILATTYAELGISG